MKFANIDTDRDVFVIAEIGNNHEGDFAVAQQMIVAAAQSGADAVKFQTIVPERLVARSDAARIARLKQFQFSYEQFAELAKLASAHKVVFFSTPFDLESARFLNTIQPVFKIASGDNNFYPLLEEVASFGKPLIVSTGLADMAQVRATHDRIMAVWKKWDVTPGLALLHCIASYPAPPEQANLRAITTMTTAFPDATIGYSDHLLGISGAVAAVAAGARVIEKHFTLDKNYSDFRDHQLSADPADMRAMVDAIREVTLLLGSGEKLAQPCEDSMAPAIRRSIAAALDLPSGATVKTEHLMWVRPGSGLPPGEEARLVGRTLNRAIPMGDLIAESDLAD